MVLHVTPKPRPSTHDKKRHGLHHKPSKHYTKTYWPYLPMLLVVLTGFIVNLTWTVGQNVLGYATNVAPVTLLQETNIQRSNNGKGALSLNSQLSQAAQAKANDMASRDYWSHTTPDGVEPWQFIANSGYTFMTAGENLAFGFDSSAGAVAGWMNSPAHKANLLNADYQEVGFGMANSASYQGLGEQTVIVAMYAKPQKVVTPESVQNGTAPAPEQAAPAAQEPQPTQDAPPAQDTPATKESVKAPAVAKAEPMSNNGTFNDTQPLPAKEVARIDVLTNGNAQWAGLALSAIASIGIITFLVRHARLWRKYLIRGENFFIKHPLLDLAIVTVGVIGFLLTRTTGFIH